MERIDDLQLNGLRVIQNPDYFCFGTDTVLLADFVKLHNGARVVDLGTGCGILPLLLYGRNAQITVCAAEIQSGLADLAQRSMALNGLQDVIRVVHMDLREAPRVFGCEHDIVVANPPYEKVDSGIDRVNESHGIARYEKCISLSELCATAARLLQTNGRFYMIHKANRLAEIFATLKTHRLEPKLLRAIHRDAASEAKYVLVCAAKDGREGMRVMRPLFVKQERSCAGNATTQTGEDE